MRRNSASKKNERKTREFVHQGREWPEVFLSARFRGICQFGGRDTDTEADILTFRCDGVAVHVRFTDDAHLENLHRLCKELYARTGGGHGQTSTDPQAAIATFAPHTADYFVDFQGSAGDIACGRGDALMLDCYSQTVMLVIEDRLELKEVNEKLALMLDERKARRVEDRAARRHDPDGVRVDGGRPLMKPPPCPPLEELGIFRNASKTESVNVGTLSTDQDEPSDPRTWPSAEMRLEYLGVASVELGGGEIGEDFESDVIELKCAGVDLALEFTDDEHLRELANLCLELVDERIARRATRRKHYEERTPGVVA